MQSAERIWKYLWQHIESSRQRQSHEVFRPRLQSLDIVRGSFPQRSRWGLCAQQRLQVNISERDDEACRGIAKVKCVEGESVIAKLGRNGPFRTPRQKNL